MSETAQRNLAARQQWAEPGSRHDKVVRLAKLGLPVGALLLGALLLISPFDRKGDVSFILDKNKVDEAPERMRVDRARYVGADDEGQPFRIEADRAVQPSSSEPVVTIEGMRARLDMAKGPLSIAALKGRYDLDAQKIAVDGPVRVAGPDGYRLDTSDVRIDLKQRRLTGSGAAEGMTRLGPFSAGSLSADLDERTVTLGGRARLKIIQGNVR